MKPPLSEYHSRRDDFHAPGLYGSLENFFRQYRESAPLDLSMEQWRAAHPGGEYSAWEQAARRATLEFLQYDPGPLDLAPTTASAEARDGYTFERVEFNVAPWCRVEGYFALPTGEGPFPAVIVLHSWGGPMILGKDRVFPVGATHPRLQELLDRGYSGKFVGEELVRRGYAVLAIDAHHFGSRLPWGVRLTTGVDVKPRLPERLDPQQLSIEEFDRLDVAAKDLLEFSHRYVGWAGATWPGINFWDDSRCVDYLLTRPEVDPRRIGCVGQSGGGIRSHFLAGLDTRIAASVSSSWLTTGDWTQVYKLVGPIGPAHLIPGLWRRLDIPDVALLAAPRPKLIICGQNDPLFAPEAMEEAASHVSKGFEWAGVPKDFYFYFPEKGHCFDADGQVEAWQFFDRYLKNANLSTVE